MRLSSTFMACLLVLIPYASGQSATRHTARPDVYLITIDTLRADHVHCYGYDKIRTPALDGLAQHGIRFAQAFTPSPITNTSHSSILTGLLPSSHGVTDFAKPLGPAHPTWAELLRKAGYQTGAFIGAVILDSKELAPGLNRGFDFYDNFPEHAPTKSRWGRVERRGMDVVRRAEAWRSAHPGGAHFMWVHLYDPHDPYEPPEPYSKLYKDRLYDGEIAYADSALGSFLSYLQQHGWYENSLIIVVGDHGEGLGEHKEDTHGVFLYDSTLHVPLILKMPGANSAKTVESQVRTTDILPTVLEQVNIPMPEKLDGESLRSYFTGTEAKGRPLYGETDYPLHFGWAPVRAMRMEEFKFIEAPRPEFYNLAEDPKELNNRYAPWDDGVQKFRKMLAAQRAKFPAPGESSASVDTGTLDELKALGYLGPADAGSATNVPEPSLLPDAKDKIEQQNLLHGAMVAADEGRLDEARNDLEKVLQLDPKSDSALMQLGELEFKASRYEKAVEYLNRAREIHPENAKAAFYQGQALEKAGDFSGARDALEAGLRQSPTASVEARVALGRVYLKMKNPKAAEDQFEAVLLSQPHDAAAEIGLAGVRVQDGQFQDAVQLLSPLAQSQPKNAEVFELLAQAYKGLGKAAEAERAEKRAQLLRTANQEKSAAGTSAGHAHH